MALNFPNSPTIGQVYTDSVSGFSYEWDGTVWKSYSAASSSQIKILDDISSSFNGIGKTFALTSNTNAVTPVSAASLIINLGGVVQDPSDDYSVSGSNIIFSDAPTNGLSFSGISLGPAVPVTTIPDGTITQGSLNVSGILSATGGFNLGISSAGSIITSNAVKTLNFIGTGNTFRVSGTTVDISIQSGGGIGIQSAGSQIGTGVTQLNFIGTGNTFRVSGGTVDVSISGGGSGVSTTGVTTAAFFSNPQYITTSYTLNSPSTNYGVFGPIYVSVGSTIIVGVGNTLAIL